jgi:hypothetical protein
MAKRKPILTPKDLALAIRRAPQKDVRACLLAIAQAFLVNGSGDLETDRDADIIEEVGTHLKAYRFWPKEVVCYLCGNTCAAGTAHLHQGKYIGDTCCWDERLRASE